MGIFCRREKLVERRLRVKVQADGNGLVQFTLDEQPQDGGNVWWACWANLMIPHPSGGEDALRRLTERSVTIVQAQIPSLTDVHIAQTADADTLVFDGSARLLRSEWHALKNRPSLAEMLNPRGHEVVRLSSTPVVFGAQAA